MTTITSFYTEQIDKKIFHRVKLVDERDRRFFIIITISKKEFDSVVRKFELQEAMPQFTSQSITTDYF
jgi:hypothetical protein